MEEMRDLKDLHQSFKEAFFHCQEQAQASFSSGPITPECSKFQDSAHHHFDEMMRKLRALHQVFDDSAEMLAFMRNALSSMVERWRVHVTLARPHVMSQKCTSLPLP